MATFAEIAKFCSLPRTRDQVADHFWPHKTGRSTHGGPSARQVIASYALGRMRKAGLVREIPERLFDDEWRIKFQATGAM